MHAMIRLVAYIYASLPLEKKLTERRAVPFTTEIDACRNAIYRIISTTNTEIVVR